MKHFHGHDIIGFHSFHLDIKFQACPKINKLVVYLINQNLVKNENIGSLTEYWQNNRDLPHIFCILHFYIGR